MRRALVLVLVVFALVAHATLDDWKSSLGLTDGVTPTLTGTLTKLKQHLEQEHPWLVLGAKAAKAAGIPLNDDPPGPEFRWSVSLLL